MDELGIDFVDAVPWFAHAQDQPYVLIHVSPASVAQLGGKHRRAAQALLHHRRRSRCRGAATWRDARRRSSTPKLPDAGATMSGDFGEVLGYFYQAARELPATAIGPKKWRLKQDRTKPAPRSDVVHFVMPNRPHASAADAILCAEVKAKATAGASTPIADAIADCKKDRTSRLASTLVWLRERALTTDLGDVDLPLLDRFIQAVDSPPVAKRFRAVAVICNALLTNELVAAPNEADPEFTLVVIGVPNLQQTYTAAFAAAQASA